MVLSCLWAYGNQVDWKQYEVGKTSESEELEKIRERLKKFEEKFTNLIHEVQAACTAPHEINQLLKSYANIGDTERVVNYSGGS